MLTLTLSTPAALDAARVLRDEIAAALETGERAFTVDIDDLAVLETPVISTLISILRDVRARGATVALKASRKSLLDTLRITALDKVFTVTAAAERPPRAVAVRRKPAAPSRGGRFVAAFLGAAFALGSLLGTRASAQSDTAPADLVRNVIAQNADMQSYQARVAVDFHLRSFPYVSEHLDGTTYFKRPDNFEVVFTRVPSYAKGFEKVYSDVDDPTSWNRRFDLSLVGERQVRGHRDYVVRLVQKVRGMIDHEDVAIDPAAWRIDRMEWHYYNGGAIAMDQEYQQVGSFTVLAKQHATIRIPFVHAAAEAVYSEYRTNVAIDDAVFTRGDRQ